MLLILNLFTFTLWAAGTIALQHKSKDNMPGTKTYGLTHLAIAVKDVERTLHFYRQVFDMQAMYHSKGFIQLTTPGCNDILVFEERTESPVGYTGGIAHFGFRLKDAAHIQEIIGKVISAGGTIIEEGSFVPGSPYVFFKDPDGYDVEVWYELLP